MDTFLAISLVVLFIGIALIAIGGISFRVRAITNKPAWNGITKPFILVGIAIFIVGIVLVYFAYSSAFGVS